jgi:glutamate/tyrosine decarboxylase-like PLP-dependent enzyme
LQPYDCGIFLTRHPHIQSETFANANAAYLSSPTAVDIPSPLNIGLENSRRFRALPVYAVLRSEGRAGIAVMLARMVQLARKISAFIQQSENYILLPGGSQAIEYTHIVVLFRAKNEELNKVLAARISVSREMYVSGTVWKGEKAVRLAISNWMVDIERDCDIVTNILTSVARGQ